MATLDPETDTLTIKETDGLDSVATTYVCSSASATKPATEQPVGFRRIDIIPPSQPKSASYLSTLVNVFLPVGYPHSVTADYLEYQIYDSLQAFSSSIAGLLASRAVLQGVGVGDATASPTAALLLSVLQDSMGRIATILFAHRLGSSLEPECKMYRLAADVMNDAAMVVDCLSPAFPKPVRVALFSVSSVLRALCGVAAGSSKASLSAHFARWGNLGELNAKDSSQETIISLIGMLVGSYVVSHISSQWATWTAMLILLATHISANYTAVRAVHMTTLNRQRANIVFSTLFQTQHHNQHNQHTRILTPEETSKQERIFERDGVLRDSSSSSILGFCRIGVSIKDLFQLSSLDYGKGGSYSTSIRDVGFDVSALFKIFEMEGYILWFNAVQRRGVIVLKDGVSAVTQLKAWSHALLVSQHLASGRWNERERSESLLDILESTLQQRSGVFEDDCRRLREVGWDIDTAALETRAGRRVSFQ